MHALVPFLRRQGSFPTSREYRWSCPSPPSLPAWCSWRHPTWPPRLPPWLLPRLQAPATAPLGSRRSLRPARDILPQRQGTASYEPFFPDWPSSSFPSISRFDSNTLNYSARLRFSSAHRMPGRDNRVRATVRRIATNKSKRDTASLGSVPRALFPQSSGPTDRKLGVLHINLHIDLWRRICVHLDARRGRLVDIDVAARQPRQRLTKAGVFRGVQNIRS